MADIKPRQCVRSHAWRREQSRRHVAAQPESGLTIEGYCVAHGLNRGTFQRWRRRFKQEAQDSEGVRRESMVRSETAFAEVLVTALEAPRAPTAIEVVLRGERRVWVAAGFEEETLRRLVAVLESLPC